MLAVLTGALIRTRFRIDRVEDVSHFLLHALCHCIPNDLKAQSSAPRTLNSKPLTEVISLDIGGMVAGAKYRGTGLMLKRANGPSGRSL